MYEHKACQCLCIPYIALYLLACLIFPLFPKFPLYMPYIVLKLVVM